MKVDEIMIKLLAKEVLEKEIDENTIKDTLMSNPALVEALYELSKMHDLAHIICLALKNIGVWGTDDIYKKFQRQQTLAVYRYEQQNYQIKVIKELFSGHKINWMLLKGSCMKHLYPQEWMRTSSDIDILVKKEDIDTAKEILCNNAGFTERVGNSTMKALLGETGVCIELHSVDESVPDFEVPLDVWDKAIPNGDDFSYRMSDELFYYCHVAHMSKNIRSGSCGVRGFLDLYLLTYKNKLDYDEMLKLCADNGLDKSAKAFLKLSECWFDDASEDKLTDVIKRIVLASGVSGNGYSKAKILMLHKGGKKAHIFSRIFLPVNVMKKQYPILEKHVWLMPFYQIKRFISIVVNGRFKNAVNEIKLNTAIRNEQLDDFDYMFKELQLKPRKL